jgi:hypothetical protein
MDAVVSVLPTPADAILAAVPNPIIKKKRCECLHTNTFSRVSQVVSVVFAGIALLSVILMSTGVAPLSVETYGFCVVVFLLGGQNALSLQSKIELGGYDTQNRRFEAQNKRLAGEVNRLTELEEGLRVDAARFKEVGLRLQTTLDESRAEVDRIKTIGQQMDAQLTASKALNEAQSKQVDALKAENERLNGLIARQEALLDRFDASLTKHTADLGDKVVAMGGSVDRLEGIEAKFGVLVEVSLGLKEQVGNLQQMQEGLQALLSKAGKGVDLQKLYLDEEKALQVEQKRIVQQFKELEAQQAAFLEREAELLRRLDEEVTKLKKLVSVHALKSEHLVLRIIPLKVQNVRFADIIAYITARNPDLIQEARADMRRRKLEKVTVA